MDPLTDIQLALLAEVVDRAESNAQDLPVLATFMKHHFIETEMKESDVRQLTVETLIQLEAAGVLSFVRQKLKMTSNREREVGEETPCSRDEMLRELANEKSWVLQLGALERYAFIPTKSAK